MILKSKFIYNAGTSEEVAGGSNTIKTNEQIDKQNELRKTLGQEPLPYESTPASKVIESTDTRTPEQIQAEKVEEDAQKLVLARAEELEKQQEEEKQRLREEASKQTETVVKISKAAPVVIKKEDPVIKSEDELEEEKLLKQLSKKAGREITSIEEFLNPKTAPTKEEKEAKEKERETAKMQFALQNKKITPIQIEEFIKDTSNLEDVAFGFFSENLKAVNPELTDAQIRERFDDRYSLNEDAESPEYKAGQRELNYIANNEIAKKHAAYLGIENEYSVFEENNRIENERKASILQKAPQFKNDVKTVAERCKTITVAGQKVEIGDDIIGEYLNEVFASEYSEKIIENGYSLDELEKNFRKKIIEDNLDNIVQGLVDSAVLKAQAGVRGVIPEKKTGVARVYNELAGFDAKKDLQERLGQTPS